MIQELIRRDFPLLTLQPEKEQTPVKCSYFLYDTSLFDEIETRLQKAVTELYDGQVLSTCSMDLNAGLAYVDITPAVVTKKSALIFLLNSLEINAEEVLYAGDSGNDLSVFLSHLDSVIVANAEESIKRLATQGKMKGRLIIAEGLPCLNGNYSSGIIEGLIAKGWISTGCKRKRA